MRNTWTAQGGGIKLEVADHIARLTIDRPDKRNALTQAMWRDLAKGVEMAHGNPDVRAVLISGSGEDFCAGADIGEFDTVRRNAETARAYESANSEAFAAIRKLPVPTIAAIRGICFGGGFGIAAACDIRLASDDARFSVPAARLGLAYPHDAMADIVHACGPQFAKYLTFTAARLSAQEALSIGFVIEVLPTEAIYGRAGEIALAIAKSAPLSVKASKAAIGAVLSGNASEMAYARTLGAATFESADYVEGRLAFKQRREPDFRGG
ncbi:MAG: enoyl-CoA hydratase/isomerase family protein [Rhizobiaceae bacterium]|nr:enoyl-CoA hydratase/isomerase family protein [Rhizobiaceae bacterium]